MELIELTQSRRSIRSFKEQSITKEDIIKILQAAQSAPSGGNCQPWHFYVINDKALKTDIVNKSCNQKFMLSAPVFIVVCADIKRSEGRYGERGRDLYCIQDTAAAIQNMLLCAKHLGLGTCWCGAFDEEKLSEILRLQRDIRPVAIIPVGYPANEPVPTKRRPLNEIATFIGENDYDAHLESKEMERKVEHCDMGDILFNDVNLEYSTFVNINFTGTDISDVNLTNGKIYNSNLCNLSINNCKLNGMTINGINICELLK